MLLGGGCYSEVRYIGKHMGKRLGLKVSSRYREVAPLTGSTVCVCVCVYIYIYIDRYIRGIFRILCLICMYFTYLLILLTYSVEYNFVF